MDYRILGNTGIKISMISLGSYLTFGHKVSSSLAKILLHDAYEAGVNYFDNAEVYARGRSEEIMGKALSELAFSRDSYMIASKVFWGGPKPTQSGLSKKHIFEACHASLRRLKVEYLDFYFCHRFDDLTDVEDVVWAMHQLVMQGKILYWGTSEWQAQHIIEAKLIAKHNHLVPPIVEQFEYNLLNRKRAESEYSYLYNKFKLGALITMPLAGGILTGKYNNSIPEGTRMSLPGYLSTRSFLLSSKGRDMYNKISKIVNLANKMDITPAQLAISWCLKNQNISSVIIGASDENQLKENMLSIKKMLLLSNDVMEEIENIFQNKPRIELVPDYNKVAELV